MCHITTKASPRKFTNFAFFSSSPEQILVTNIFCQGGPDIKWGQNQNNQNLSK